MRSRPLLTSVSRSCRRRSSASSAAVDADARACWLAASSVRTVASCDVRERISTACCSSIRRRSSRSAASVDALAACREAASRNVAASRRAASASAIAAWATRSLSAALAAMRACSARAVDRTASRPATCSVILARSVASRCEASLTARIAMSSRRWSAASRSTVEAMAARASTRSASPSSSSK